MKKVFDYNFCNSWQLDELGIRPHDEFRILMDLDDLKKGDLVRFVGFDDVDNHYGIFVFADSEGRILEVTGDCSGRHHTCITNLKRALSKL